MVPWEVCIPVFSVGILVGVSLLSLIRSCNQNTGKGVPKAPRIPPCPPRRRKGN